MTVEELARKQYEQNIAELQMDGYPKIAEWDELSPQRREMLIGRTELQIEEQRHALEVDNLFVDANSTEDSK